MRTSILALIFCLSTAGHALAESSTHGGGGAKTGEAEAPPVPSQRIEIPDDYCANISDKARDARYQLQSGTLAELQKQLEAQTAKLEEKRQAVEALLKKRDEEVNLARKELVDIYAKVKPDVAAIQLALLPPETAASVLRQLNPRGASTIINEMKPEVAATIAALLAIEPDDEKARDQGS